MFGEQGSPGLGITKARVVQEAQRRIPTLQKGLPEGFYRSDLLPPDQAVKGTIEKDGSSALILDERILKIAYVPLNYDEGFPTLPDGRPFWSRLDFEPEDAYMAFTEYLEQGTKGARQVAQLTSNQKLLTAIVEKRRQLTDGKTEHALAHQLQLTTGAVAVTISELSEWYYVYYWGARARSHDLFYMQSMMKSREMMALILDNRHYRDSSRLYDKIMQFVGLEKDEDGKIPDAALVEGSTDLRFWREATPKTLTDLLKLVVQMQRMSLGIPANAPSDFGKEPRNGRRQARDDDSTNGLSGGGGGTGDDGSLDDDERVRRIAAILNAARARRAGQANS